VAASRPSSSSSSSSPFRWTQARSSWAELKICY
jgi:hypothetical protein